MNDEALRFLRFVDWGQVPTALAAIVAAVVLVRLSTRFLDRIGERFTRRRLVFKQLAAIVKFLVVMVTAAFVVTALVTFSNEALLAIGGSAALAFGFAFKDILASLIAGMILLFDRPFSVGDRISFDGHYGEVLQIGLRSVRLKTLDDNLVSIPNNKFLTDAVASANAGALHQMVVLRFYIGCDQDFVDAKRILREAAVSSRYIHLDEPVVVHLRERAVPGMETRFALELTLKAYVFDGRFEIDFGTDVTERARSAFRERGILTVGELPVPCDSSAE